MRELASPGGTVLLEYSRVTGWVFLAEDKDKRLRV